MTARSEPSAGPAGAAELELVGGTATGRSSSQLWHALTDGTIGIGAGSALAAAFAPSVVTTFVTANRAGRWWFVGLALAGLLSVTLGVWQRRRLQRRASVGVVITIDDGTGDRERLNQERSVADHQLSQACTVAMRVTSSVPERDGRGAAATVDRAADQLVRALTLAERVAVDPPAAQVVPMMRLDMAFRLGARLGYTFSRPLVVLDKRQDEGPTAYFPAVRLRADEPTRLRLEVLPENIERADPDRVAVAVDLQGRGEDFHVAVRAACEEYGYGRLLLLSSRTVRLGTTTELAYQPVVDEIYHHWRKADVPPAARHNERGVFLSGPPSIAVALGAVLAHRTRGL